MILTIQKISRKDKETVNGLKLSVGILTEEYKDKWLNGWGDSTNAIWKIGDKVEAVVEQKGQYLNFKAIKPSVPPPAEQPVEAQLRRLDIEDKEAVKNNKIRWMNSLTNAVSLFSFLNGGTDVEVVKKEGKNMVEDLANWFYNLEPKKIGDTPTVLTDENGVRIPF